MGAFILFGIIGFLELYLFTAFRQAFEGTIWLRPAQIVIIASFLLFIVTYFRVTSVYRQGYGNADGTTNLLMGFSFAFFIALLVSFFVFVAEDIFRIIHYMWQWLPFQNEAPAFVGRRKFIGQAAALTAALPFAGLVYGVLKGRYSYKIYPLNLSFADLPKPFDGFKIVQISDVHSGSFDNVEVVEKAVNMIQAQQPDMIVFTGDWVNSFADELLPYINIFKKLEAPYGKYAVWGNHDYRFGGNSFEKHRQRIGGYVREMGFKVLENANLKIEKEAAHIRLFGVENWGKPPFPQVGDLQKAKENSQKGEFSILLSHDPTHWDAKVIQDDHHFHLTLSGHTHGAQMGIEAAWLRWSPSKYIYPRWAGLYEAAGKFLYVNRGFGYLGYPGRAGIPPEITTITLQHKV